MPESRKNKKYGTIIDRMERKFGKYAIPNLIKYILGAYVLGTVLCIIAQYTGRDIYSAYLALDFSKVLHGQIWRIITFVIMPPRDLSGSFSIFWVVIEIYMYYLIGTVIENTIGAFRFNCYYFLGVLLNIIACLIIYILFGFSGSLGVYYINRSMFFLFALLYPNQEFLLFFFIPVKAKWLAWLDAFLIGYDLIRYFRAGILWADKGYKYFALLEITFAISIIISLLNFVIFYLDFRKKAKPSRRRRRASKAFAKKFNEAKNSVTSGNGARHKCCICGRTELDDDSLQFRYCSKCKGNREYCSDHLFTHEHVR